MRNANDLMYYFITVCKSCIVKYLDLEKNNKCPRCELIIHQSHPLNYIRYARSTLTASLIRPKLFIGSNLENVCHFSVTRDHCFKIGKE